MSEIGVTWLRVVARLYTLVTGVFVLAGGGRWSLDRLARTGPAGEPGSQE